MLTRFVRIQLAILVIVGIIGGCATPVVHPGTESTLPGIGEE